MVKCRKLRNKRIICVIGALGILFLIFFMWNLYVLLSTPQKYMITADNHFNYQSGFY